MKIAVLFVVTLLLVSAVMGQEPINVAETQGSPQGVDAGQGIPPVSEEGTEGAMQAPTESATSAELVPGSQGPAGQLGRDGAPGARGARGHRGSRGARGPAGRGAQLPKDWQRQTPRVWSGNSTKALKGDGTGLHAGRPMTREEGAALTQRGDAKVETAANRHTDKKVGEERTSRIAGDDLSEMTLILVLIVFTFAALAAGIIFFGLARRRRA